MIEDNLTPIQSTAERERSQGLSLQPTRPPADVPGYDLEKFLGKGAFGEVWLAVNRNTGVRVAVKFYTHADGLDWSLLSREVEKLRFLANDRYVVQLLEIGWDAVPPFYVMEYVEEGSLEDWLKDGPLGVVEAETLFREIAVALSHAHNKGILHCDLKPGNILLDQDGKPRLADFGQSRRADDDSPALGTWFYMAPEQADLKAAPDARWDVYALGAVLYRMLTGQAPFQSDEAVNRLRQSGKLSDRLASYRRYLRDAAKPAGHRQSAGIDRALIEILDRCLAVQPARRYPNVQAVIDALDARALRRAQRPLLVLGAIGPALALAAIWLFTWLGFQSDVEATRSKVSRHEQENLRTAARFVAETVSRQIDQRWRVLEEEAGRPDFRRLVAEASAADDFDDPRRQELQRVLEDQFIRHARGTEASSWFVDDQRGRLIAGAPLKDRIRKVINSEFWYRDYFHGLGRDLDPANPPAVKPGPTRQPHLSNVFKSKAMTKRPWIVGFTVPVWAEGAGAGSGSPIGILGMAVEVGGFGEFQDSPHKWAVLVDIKTTLADRPGRHGVILQHPELEEWQSDSAGEGQLPVTSYMLQPDLASALAAWRHERGASTALPETLALPAEYQDPFADRDEKYGGAWLAAMAPVFVQRQQSRQDTGWVVIVQERHAVAVSWVEQLIDDLRSGMFWRGLLALVIVIVVVTALSSIVMRNLNTFSKSRLAAFLKRRAGLATDSSAVSGSASARRSSSPRPSPTPLGSDPDRTERQ